MSKIKDWLLQQQENNMEQDEIDASWHQKQLDEQQMIEIAKERNMFEWQAIQDAIYYSKRLRAVKDK